MKPVLAFLVGGIAATSAFALTAPWTGNESLALPIAKQTPLVEQFKGSCDGQARIEQQAQKLHLALPNGCSVRPS